MEQGKLFESKPADELRGLSLYEPWATAVSMGYKRWETRSWRTTYRGWVLIHASASTKHLKSAPELFAKAGIVMPLPTFLPRHVLAVARIVECIEVEQIVNRIHAADFAFGDWTAGRFAWRLEDVYRLPEPFAWNGALGLWTTSEELRSKALAGMRPAGS